jgi:hypothetical protein
MRIESGPKRWIAICALVTLAWPSLGTLPWIAMARSHAATHVAHTHDRGLAHHDNASDIPGSPTHPLDHDCAQCDVLKHLARCAPAALAPPMLAFQSPAPVQPVVADEAAGATRIALLPPVRAPPPPLA